MEQLQEAPQQGWIKERVFRGEYSISEHVLRMLTSGHFSMAELEESLANGQISEYRRNRQGCLGSLVCGQSGYKEIRSLCVREQKSHMSLLLTYLSPSPDWEQDRDLEEIKDESMNSDTRQCFFCGGDVLPILVGNFDYRLDGQLYVIKKVPAGLCQECGEKYISSMAAHSINDGIERQAYSGTDQVQVMVFPQESTA